MFGKLTFRGFVAATLLSLLMVPGIAFADEANAAAADVSMTSEVIESDAPEQGEEKPAPKHRDELAYVDGAWYAFDAAGNDTGVVRLRQGWNTYDGQRYWLENASTMARDQWKKIDGARYRFDGKGRMLTGHQQIDGKRYFFFDDGKMLSGSGWTKVANRWYYLGASGVLAADEWKKIAGTWYLFDEKGRMRTGWAQVDGRWYLLDASGAMQTGWKNIGGSWYYLRGSGAMAEGWARVGGTWYYLKPGSGAMQTGWIELDDTWYYLDASGAMQTGWNFIKNKWYYLGGSGAMKTGWKKIGNTWYCFNESGSMKSREWYFDEDYDWWYYFAASGRMVPKADTGLHDMIEGIIDDKIGRGPGALKRAFNYTVSYAYRNGSKYPSGEWSVPYAKEMYRRGSGNCYRFAALFCWLARGLGYDAEVVSGWVPGRAVAKAPHGWVEIRQGGGRYVCDPDLAHEIPSRNWYMRTYANAPTAYGWW
ncbi:transglutaminase domain-containing protein [Xiamenia xianingshaonis]|uniref:Transglutaminase-like domain-containing protein n=1 Tax=Xiamenia xianingshaonis TaxID=2682776 RepID=A0A9E6MRF8_9ACTN|nr:transglutaminase domain-containing protein [Xiamenia xianingshaonis]NHM14313.1 hypothetical protein [Xiamenia xianingshaonis]QTU84795.1 hypothetical protein J7S26_02445 [Xiamenia xianingshaonis]